MGRTKDTELAAVAPRLRVLLGKPLQSLDMEGFPAQLSGWRGAGWISVGSLTVELYWEAHGNIFELINFDHRLKIVFWPDWETINGSTAVFPTNRCCHLHPHDSPRPRHSVRRLAFVSSTTVDFGDIDLLSTPTMTL